MNKQVGDKMAISFAGAFYQALAFDRTVTEAFELARAELDLVHFSGANLPEIFIRDGVDREEPILALSEDTDEEVAGRLSESLVHLASGKANEDERGLIRRELINGALIIEQIEGAAETESDVTAALSDITSYRPIRIEIGEATYRRIQEQLYPSPPFLPPPLPGLMFVGREDSLTDIKKLIGISQPSQRTGNVTVVRGWPGVGKNNSGRYFGSRSGSGRGISRWCSVDCSRSNFRN